MEHLKGIRLHDSRVAVGRQGGARKSKTVDELFSSCLSVPGNRNVDIFSVVDVGGRDKVEMARGGNGCWTGGYNPCNALALGGQMRGWDPGLYVKPAEMRRK